MQKELLHLLLKLKNQYGDALFEDKRRLLAIVKDYLPFLKHMHRLLKISMTYQVYEALNTCVLKDMMVIRNQCMSLLCEEGQLERRDAEEIVDFWLSFVKHEKGLDTAFSEEHLLGEKITKEPAKEMPAIKSVEAMLLKASSYYNGEGTKQNDASAFFWYQKAAKAGSSEAMNMLGNMYYIGQGTEKNYKEALYWYKEAAQKGSPIAMNHIGNMYYEGKGVAKSEEEALKWYQKAMVLGHYAAMFNMGYLYYEKHMQGWENPFTYYLEAAEKGDMQAVCHVAYCYHTGDGISQDYKEALKWYLVAAEKGETSAMIWLAYMYLNGQGVEKDKHMAKVWCEKAIKLHE